MKLADARRLALAFPEAAEAPHFDFTSLRVRGRIFATAPPDGAFLVRELLERAWKRKAPKALVRA